ncbi:MAG: phytanoyl-CoA dioxygenase family protein, partial [Pirellulaceae bacterium]|nr:phytanoyl-CoA dioxygenase family protein [Pirellulaceae bacterium]
MARDLSLQHDLVSDFCSGSRGATDLAPFRLSAEQVEFFRLNGYLAGVRILTEDQIAQLRAELTELLDAQHDGHELWYEYHTNESADPDTVLFHSLGAWRLRPGFHDLLWHPAFTTAASQLLDGPVRLWHDQLFC